ncbi:MAG: asparagine synthase (glutamine-hydrolyzing) [Gammaproteobacteria bacterium]|nr:asparagine synthase (glutamine-hydrolyzing) [Gammaproteobacteria bacterium]
MCGFAGFYDERPETNPFNSILGNMLQAITHRGPNDEGIWAEQGIYLGHRRLSILDLSAAGHQPMLSASQQYVIAFNGEIYNFQQIRQQLERNHAITWRGHSDTEVMLAAIETWGLDQALSQFNGMFAFALWDRKSKTLTLARDRLGEKPLYYSHNQNRIIFGSELTTLEQFPDLNKEIDREALGEYFKYSYIPAPYSIYKDVKKLKPAHYLVWSPRRGVIQERCYWDIQSIAAKSQKQIKPLSDQEAIEQLDVLLKDSVSLRMEADVPLGSFLSGGIDSSVVSAVMQSQSTIPVRTFSIGFDIPGYNEAVHAAAVAKHLGTNHTEHYVTGSDALAVVPKLGTLYDEPFADSSQIPMYLVSQMAKQHVTVCLSGDGGDELFGGYSRYFMSTQILKKLKRLPMRRSIQFFLEKTPFYILDYLAKIASSLTKLPLTASKLKTFAPLLSAHNQYELYCLLMMCWRNPQSVVLECTNLYQHDFNFDLKDFIHVMMMHDSLTYLPGDILTKVDRATMAVSLEGRIPLLDHRVAEFAWCLPLSQKVRDDQGKWLLRQVLYQYVPQSLIDRPKMGFGIPLAEWLRTDLADWAGVMLNPDKLKRQGLLNYRVVDQIWQSHLHARADYSSQLWSVIMLQAWLAERGL